MKFFISLSFAPLLFLFCRVDWIIGIPIPNEEGAGNSTQEDQPASDQPPNSFPFHDYQNESMNYYVVDDMVIRKDPSRAGLRDAAWPNGVVPYSFAFTLSPNQKSMIMQAQSEIEAVVPCVKFRPITREDTYNIEYRNDAMNAGCSSFVGWQNRKNQPVQLAAVCSKGNAIHEIMHALGFFHEQTRDDRDTYVRVNLQNVQPGYENNFKKDGELYPDAPTNYFDVPYNYDSIMHYGKTYFSKNGQNTIDPLYHEDAIGNGDNIGQRDYISQGDIMMMRRKYGCDAEEATSGGSEPGEGASGGEGGENQGGETGSEGGEGSGAEAGETEAPEETEAPTAKPTTKNPLCAYNPGLPNCKSTTKAH